MRELETQRLKLRKLREDDAESIFNNWATDPEVTKFLTWYPHKDISETEKILNQWLEEYGKPDCYRYGIESKQTGELMGMIDVVGYHHGNPVLGSAMGRRFWNQGYNTEALKAVVKELQTVGFDTIVAEAADANIGSNTVIKKCGFELVGTWESKISDKKPDILPVNSYRLFKNKRKSDDYNDLNSETIDRWVDEGWEWGKPISHEVYENAKKGDWNVVLTPTKPVPKEWFGDLKGKRVLGLASGGGQQIPIFTALGADCWVLDFSAKQIETEKAVASREGYNVHAIRADMTKPLPFSDGFFDMIFHPVSNCYIEKVEPVWKECARILKKGGRLISGLDNGFNFLFEEDDG